MNTRNFLAEILISSLLYSGAFAERHLDNSLTGPAPSAREMATRRDNILSRMDRLLSPRADINQCTSQSATTAPTAGTGPITEIDLNQQLGLFSSELNEELPNLSSSPASELSHIRANMNSPFFLARRDIRYEARGDARRRDFLNEERRRARNLLFTLEVILAGQPDTAQYQPEMDRLTRVFTSGSDSEVETELGKSRAATFFSSGRNINGIQKLMDEIGRQHYRFPFARISSVETTINQLFNRRERLNARRRTPGISLDERLSLDEEGSLVLGQELALRGMDLSDAPEEITEDPAVKDFFRNRRVRRFLSLETEVNVHAEELKRFLNSTNPQHSSRVNVEGYFLSKNARRFPFVYSYLVTRNPVTRELELLSAALVEGTPRANKDGNVRISFVESSNLSDRALRNLHQENAWLWLDSARVTSPNQRYRCQFPLYR